MQKILVVDDEAKLLTSIQKMLSRQEYEVVTAGKAEEALSVLDEVHPNLVLMDINLPGMNGIEAFQQIKKTHPRLPVIILTAHGTTETAIEATKIGAFDYVLKPFDPNQLLQIIHSALESVRLMQGVIKLNPPESPLNAEALVGQSLAMQNVYKSIGRVASTEVSILLRGETGVGKELVARAIYQHSLRNEEPLLVVNCPALPETLLESELFGHEKGAFTGAVSQRLGKFEQAHKGTLFLDEIGEMPLSVQAKILRVLQTKSFERIGGSEIISSDVRVIAATNRDLEKMIKDGEFREDLYHRLNVVNVIVPPLRERREDIPRLTEYFLGIFGKEMGREVPPISPKAITVLKTYSWPGNVRELRHCLHRTFIFNRRSEIHASDIEQSLKPPTEVLPAVLADSTDRETLIENLIASFLESRPGPTPHRNFLEMVDKNLITTALKMTRGNHTHAASLLGLARPTLLAKLNKYGIQREIIFRQENNSQ